MPPPSPTSLLWAHQLRREHIALVSSLSDLKSSTTASIASTSSTLTARLDKLECILDETRAELENIKRLVGELETGRDREGDEFVRKVKAEVEMEVIATAREEIKVLKEMVEELTKERSKLADVLLFLLFYSLAEGFAIVARMLNRVLHDREYRDSGVLNACTKPTLQTKLPGTDSCYATGVVDGITQRLSRSWPLTNSHPRVCTYVIQSCLSLHFR